MRQKKEPIRPGDHITYTDPFFGAGDKRGIREASVIAVRPKENHILILSNGAVLPSDTNIRRTKVMLRKKLTEHLFGVFRKITDFKLRKLGDVDGCIIQEKIDEVTKITNKNLTKLQKRIGEGGMNMLHSNIQSRVEPLQTNEAKSASKASYSKVSTEDTSDSSESFNNKQNVEKDANTPNKSISRKKNKVTSTPELDLVKKRKEEKKKVTSTPASTEKKLIYKKKISSDSFSSFSNSFLSDSNSFSNDSNSCSSDSNSSKSDSNFCLSNCDSDTNSDTNSDSSGSSPFLMQKGEDLPIPVLPHLLILKDYEVPMSKYNKVSLRGFNADSYNDEQLNMMPQSLRKMLIKNSPNQGKKSSNTTSRLTNRKRLEVYRGPAKGFLEDYPGWIHQKKIRLCGVQKRYLDPYYYSPETGKKFDSLVQVKKFLMLLETTHGDEDRAYALWAEERFGKTKKK